MSSRDLNATSAVRASGIGQERALRQSAGYVASSTKGSGTLEVRIEELLIEGSEAENRADIGAVLSRELARALTNADPALLSENREIHQLAASTVDVDCRSSSEPIGVTLARVIYGGLKK